jgi:translation elongation factor EF-4
VPKAKSVRWTDFRREGHESYARMARMRQFGKVEIPQEAFIQALKMEDR